MENTLIVCWRMEGHTLRAQSGKSKLAQDDSSVLYGKQSGARKRGPSIEERLKCGAPWPAAGIYDGRNGPSTFFQQFNCYKSSF